MIVHSKMPLAIVERHGAHQERKKGMTGAPHIGVRVGADGVGGGEKGKGEQAYVQMSLWAVDCCRCTAHVFSCTCMCQES